jgi:hypothetical protein
MTLLPSSVAEGVKRRYSRGERAYLLRWSVERRSACFSLEGTLSFNVKGCFACQPIVRGTRARGTRSGRCLADFSNRSLVALFVL